MGFREALGAVFGTTRLPKASVEKLFAISTACVTMEAELGLKASPVAGLCFKPVESAGFEATRTEIEQLLAISFAETGTKYRLQDDEFHFTWVVFEDKEFEALVASVHLVSQTLVERGFGDYLLCAIFRFANNHTVYWIYNFKQGQYYPFVPLPGNKRDSAYEFRLRSLLERELPVEKEVEKWYPLWGIPF